MNRSFYIVHDKPDLQLALADHRQREPSTLPGIICVMLNARQRILTEPGFEGLGIAALDCPHFEYVDLPIQAALKVRQFKAEAPADIKVVSTKPILPRTLRALTRLRVPHQFICPIMGNG